MDISTTMKNVHKSERKDDFYEMAERWYVIEIPG